MPIATIVRNESRSSTVTMSQALPAAVRDSLSETSSFTR